VRNAGIQRNVQDVSDRAGCRKASAFLLLLCIFYIWIPAFAGMAATSQLGANSKIDQAFVVTAFLYDRAYKFSGVLLEWRTAIAKG
jgi:hypothetical protein